MSDMVSIEERWKLGRVAFVISFLTFLFFASAVGLYGRFGGDLVDSLDESLGEVMMERGIRAQDTGDLEAAKAAFHKALDNPFYGQQNQADTLKRLGVIYWSEQQYDSAMIYFMKVLEMDPPPISVFEPYCDSLINLNRMAEARAVQAQWLALAEKLGSNDEYANAKFFEGRIALKDDDRERAVASFLEGLQRAPGGRNASELADLLAETGAYAEALEYADAYLETGTGPRAVRMRELRATLLERLKNPETALPSSPAASPEQP